MVIKENEQAVDPVQVETGEDALVGKPDVSSVELPFLGRSARVVGDWNSVDASETPQEKTSVASLANPSSTGISTGSVRNR